MDLKQLEYFVRIAEIGSFTQAAIALDVAQPALSRQVRLLEVELRQNLLVRNGRGAKPTEAGQLLLEHGRGILHQVEVARAELSAGRGSLAGRVALGLPPSLSRLITVPLARAFQQHLPHAQLTLTEGFSALMYEGVRLGNLDLAVLYHPSRSPELEMHALRTDALVLISPRLPIPTAKVGSQTKSVMIQAETPVELHEVAELPLILPSRPNVFRNLIDGELMHLGLRMQPVLEVDGLNAILCLVKEGMGHAVLPSYTLYNFDQPAPFIVRPIHKPLILSELNLAWSARRPVTPTHRHAMTLIKEVVHTALGESA